MAMRLRKIRGEWRAICAAECPEEPGDIYIDDAQDHAIREKIEKDWESEGLIPVDGERLQPTSSAERRPTMIDTLTIMSERFSICESSPAMWSDTGMGRGDEKGGRVVINADMPEEQRRATVIHEAVHMMFSMGGYEPDEPLVCFLSCAIFSLIRDNPELVAWVQDGG